MNERMVVAESNDGILATASERVHSFFCGLYGHDLVLSIKPGRISLQCMSCPYETPGWTLKQSRQADLAAGHSLASPGLVEQNAQ